VTRRATDVLPLLLGVAALAAGTVFGWNEGFVNLIVMPPPVLRAALVGGSVVVGIALFGAALRRLAGDGGGVPVDRASDWPTMVRGIRLAFLGVAALAAAAGWVLGHPLPIVVALVIAGVDVVETSFLLLVARSRGS
jgi:hypothetical protein